MTDLTEVLERLKNTEGLNYRTIEDKLQLQCRWQSEDFQFVKKRAADLATILDEYSLVGTIHITKSKLATDGKTIYLLGINMSIPSFNLASVAQAFDALK